MASPAPPTIDQFYRFCGERRLMGLKCKKCKSLLVPPRNLCPKCLGTDFEWRSLEGIGTLITYTVIHFPPTQFQALAPYAVGIVKLREGVRLPGMIKNVKLEELKIGMELQADFETGSPKEWPQWPRYYFRPP